MRQADERTPDENMAKCQLPTSTKGGSKGFAPPRKTATKTAPRPKARPSAPARFESKPPPPPPTDPVGAKGLAFGRGAVLVAVLRGGAKTLLPPFVDVGSWNLAMV